MGLPISNDLRRRMVRASARGETCRAVAEKFDVAPSTAGRLFARYLATGSVAPAPQGRERGRGKLGPHRDYLIDRVKQKPDITMPELAAMLSAERGVTVDPSNISKLLCAAGFTYKKNAVGVGTRTLRREGGAA